MRLIRNVPTNVIFGFLGVGKTSAILHWLKHKPADQRWAVLVNEFGEVGIDGALYEQQGIAVKEIPGGCMCCAQGLPLQVAVNRLLRETVPDRLLIETSGIGHPRGVLDTLHGDGFRGVLDLKAVIGLVDPEQLLDPACQASERFLQQLALADVLVANKTDVASAAAMDAFDRLSKRFARPKALVTATAQGHTQPDWLDHEHTDRGDDSASMPVGAEPETDWQTFHWTFPNSVRFDLKALRAWVAALDVVRLKGIVQTTEGARSVNAVAGAVSEDSVRADGETRLQIIDRMDVSQDSEHRRRALEQGLRACIALPRTGPE